MLPNCISVYFRVIGTVLDSNIMNQFNSIQFNSFFSVCQIHFSASTKHSIQIHKCTVLTYFIVTKQMLKNTDAGPEQLY